ncbi:MAG: hypothetical protein Q8Q54_09390 [Methylococcales bacterium]|nr:hypothetical protein [Methylococcales bacterium]MDP3839120.1 hypothetical protein [Methylococcales bacterium]
MSQVTLELENNEDEKFILELLKRLGISYSIQNESDNELNTLTDTRLNDGQPLIRISLDDL